MGKAMSDGGKGDKRRPTNEAAYAEGWERVWGPARREIPHSEGLPNEDADCDAQVGA